METGIKTAIAGVYSGVVLLVLLAFFILCYYRSRGKYDEYLEYVDKEEYGLKDFLPIGLEAAEILPKSIGPMTVRTFLAQHRNTVYQKILELRGPKEVGFYDFIHVGYRWTAAVLSALIAAAAGLIMSVQGDSGNGVMLSSVAVLAFFFVPYAVDASLNDQIKKRRVSIQMEFPEFINKLTLLVNAGMTISKAWSKIVNENRKDHVLYNEMRLAQGDIKAGKPEAVAYEDFARRCHVKEVTKFVSVIVMNLSRGGSDVVPVLKEQGNECWEMRKSAARMMGEQASTKILIPMMIMFMGIVLIVATPAVLSMTQGM